MYVCICIYIYIYTYAKIYIYIYPVLKIVSFILVMFEPKVQNVCQAWFSKLPQKRCRTSVQWKRDEVS